MRRGSSTHWTRRDWFCASAALGSMFALGGLARESQEGAMRMRPPTALPEGEFLATCVRCSRCVSACPLHAIRLTSWSDGLLTMRTPVLDFHLGYCNFCMQCTQVCPVGALHPAKPIADYEKPTPLGIAHLTQYCIALRSGGCTKCYEVCPEQAITLSSDRVPQIHEQDCTGCGLCVLRCPSNVLQSYLGAAERGIEVTPRGEL